MRQGIYEIHLMMIDAFIYLFAMTVAFGIIRVESKHVDVVSDKINQKVNVYELDDNYEEKEYLVSSASILYDVKSCKKGTIINIDGYELTENDWKKIHEEGDNFPVLNHIQFSHDYTREYITDDEGIITGIKYMPEY